MTTNIDKLLHNADWPKFGFNDQLDVLEPKRMSWSPYKGPRGGRGWQNEQTGEVRYQEHKPSERGEGEDELEDIDSLRKKYNDLRDQLNSFGEDIIKDRARRSHQAKKDFEYWNKRIDELSETGEGDEGGVKLQEAVDKARRYWKEFNRLQHRPQPPKELRDQVDAAWEKLSDALAEEDIRKGEEAGLEPGEETEDGGHFEPREEPDLSQYIANQYPVTDWIDGGTGFLLANGEGVDMGYGQGSRMDDHRAALPTERAMKRWGWSDRSYGPRGNRTHALRELGRRSGAIRVMSGTADSLFWLEVYRPLTGSQRASLARYIRDVQPGEVRIEVATPAEGVLAHNDFTYSSIHEIDQFIDEAFHGGDARPSIAEVMKRRNELRKESASYRRDYTSWSPEGKRVMARLAKKTAGMNKWNQFTYRKSIGRVIGTMTDEAQRRLDRAVKDAVFYDSAQEITEAWRYRFKLTDAQEIGGVWDSGKDIIHLDGGYSSHGGAAQKIDELYAHEFTHAIDDGDHIANSDDWQEAWAEEINPDIPEAGKPLNIKLTKYAGTSPYEGLAEFGRLIFLGRYSEAKKYPKCYEVFRKHGLTHDTQ